MMILNLKQEYSLIVGINEQLTISTTSQYRRIALQVFKEIKFTYYHFSSSSKNTQMCVFIFKPFALLCFGSFVNEILMIAKLD